MSASLAKWLVLRKRGKSCSNSVSMLSHGLLLKEVSRSMMQEDLALALIMKRFARAWSSRRISKQSWSDVKMA